MTTMIFVNTLSIRAMCNSTSMSSVLLLLLLLLKQVKAYENSVVDDYIAVGDKKIYNTTEIYCI